MNLKILIKTLVGAGDRIMAFTLPLAVVVIILNILYPQFFQLNGGGSGMIIGWILLIVGVPIWLASVVLVMLYVPRNKLITRGPFALIRHPLYTSVALLVLPGLGFLLDTWSGMLIGLILYIFSRIFSVREEEKLDDVFAGEYQLYRSKVLLPWL